MPANVTLRQTSRQDDVNFFRLTLFCIAVLLSTHAQANTTIILRADQDLTVSALDPKRTESAMTRHILSAGIGYTNRAGRMQGYMRFDLGEIPRNDWKTQISIDSAYLHLFVLAHSLTYEDERYDEKRYLMSISGCHDSSWLETEMAWSTRVCADGGRPQDAKIIDGEHLPAQHTWDVTEQFSRLPATSQDGVTLIADAQRLLSCSRDPLEGIGCPDFPEKRGFLNIASRNREAFGISVMPRVVVSYSERPTPLMTYANSTLAVISAVGVLLGLYGGVRSLRRRKA